MSLLLLSFSGVGRGGIRFLFGRGIKLAAIALSLYTFFQLSTINEEKQDKILFNSYWICNWNLNKIKPEYIYKMGKLSKFLGDLCTQKYIKLHSKQFEFIWFWKIFFYYKPLICVLKGLRHQILDKLKLQQNLPKNKYIDLKSTKNSKSEIYSNCLVLNLYHVSQSMYLL